MTKYHFFMNKVWDICTCDFYFLLNTFSSKCLFVCLFVCQRWQNNSQQNLQRGSREDVWLARKLLKLFNAFPFFALHPTLHIVRWTQCTHYVTAHVKLHTAHQKLVRTGHCILYNVQCTRTLNTLESTNCKLDTAFPFSCEPTFNSCCQIQRGLPVFVGTGDRGISLKYQTMSSLSSIL